MEDREINLDMDDLLTTYRNLIGETFIPSSQKTCKRRKLGVPKNSDTEIRNNE